MKYFILVMTLLIAPFVSSDDSTSDSDQELREFLRKQYPPGSYEERQKAEEEKKKLQLQEARNGTWACQYTYQNALYRDSGDNWRGSKLDNGMPFVLKAKEGVLDKQSVVKVIAFDSLDESRLSRDDGITCESKTHVLVPLFYTCTSNRLDVITFNPLEEIGAVANLFGTVNTGFARTSVFKCNKY